MLNIDSEPMATPITNPRLWLSMIAAVGLASRPTRSRSAITSVWFIRSKEAKALLEELHA